MEGFTPIILNSRQLALDSVGTAVKYPEFLLGADLCFNRCFWFLTGNACHLKPASLGTKTREYLEHDGRFPIDFDRAVPAPLSIILDRVPSTEDLLVRLYPLHPRPMAHWIVIKADGIFDPSHGNECTGRRGVAISQWILAWRRTFGVARIHRFSRN